MIKEAERLRSIPPYLFARIEQKIAAARAKGEDIISLGIGDPDLPTPDFVIEKMAEEIYKPENHQYPSSAGMTAFRRAAADFYKRRFGVELDGDTEVCTLIGSKEGIANINYCYVDPGSVNLIPDPGYPVYGIATTFAGGRCHKMPLLAKNGFLPDLDAIDPAIAREARIMFLNYPNNPTGAVCGKDFFKRVVDFAKEYNILVCHDNAYSEMTYDGFTAPGFLQIPGAKEVGIEFNSLSKPFNMTGWRIGFAAGNPEVIAALAKYKSNVDSGVFQAVQAAGIAGLNRMEPVTGYLKGVYAKRRDILVGGLNRMGWNLPLPKATFYVWAPVPAGYTSASFAEAALEKAGVVITPGSGYGEYGEGYFRATLTVEESRLREAMSRLSGAFGQVSF